MPSPDRVARWRVRFWVAAVKLTDGERSPSEPGFTERHLRNAYDRLVDAETRTDR